MELKQHQKDITKLKDKNLEGEILLKRNRDYIHTLNKQYACGLTDCFGLKYLFKKHTLKLKLYKPIDTNYHYKTTNLLILQLKEMIMEF